MNEQKLLSIGKTAEILGVCLDTLREWDKEDKLVPVKTPGGHRRYKWTDIQSFCGVLVKQAKDANTLSSLKNIQT